jgi:succinoglycan biosynthesis transport protein ExoP
MKNMNLIQILLILRAHYKVALVTLLAVSSIGIVITLMVPRQYVATTDIVFDSKSADPVIGQLLPVLPGYIATQVEIIRSERVAQRVVKATRLDENPTVRADWTRETEGKGKIEAWLGKLLLNKLGVTASRDTSIIQISYTNADPGFAVVIANSFAQAYLDANIELRVDPARQHARWFEGQGKSLRENLEKAQTKLTEFQQQRGIVAKDEQFDAETTKLSELSSQLTVAMGQTADAQSKQRSGADTLPEVMRNSVVMGLRSDIARLEGRLQEAAVNLGRNHPQYQRMENELAALIRQLQVETQRVTNGFSSTRSVSKDNEAELRTAIAAQEKKLLQLKSQRNLLAVLQRDVAAAQSAYETVTTRYNQSTLESQMTQANASVLSYASEPTAPAFSKILKGLVISLGAGILLGVGLAFLIELIDRRVRCIDDLVDAIKLPVLSVIQSSRPHRQVRLFLGRRNASVDLA